LQKNKELQQEISRREEAENAFQKADEQLSIISQQEASRWGIESFIGKSKTIANILDEVRQLQKSSATSVLITGESGTGKELIARAIHFGSDRSKGPFIVLNCTAIPGELAESSLFGHVRGAFSGAIAYHKGYFEQADGGTLFLDEIGDMPLALQPKLLRVIEDGLITPLGDTHEKHVDVRILAANNQDLQKKIAGGTFRSDLYFRLEHFRVTVPPLRERKEDIPLLVEHFLNMISGISKPTISQEVMSALENYQFPGNVRELKNIMERALIKSRGSMIRLEHLQFIHTDIQPKSDEHNSTDETKILTYIRQHGSINNAECRELLLVDRRRAAYLLEKMHHQGLLVQRSSRRWAQYYIPI